MISPLRETIKKNSYLPIAAMPDTLDHSPPIYAALDLGSNSFHMLIVRYQNGKLEVLDRHKEMVRLAAGLQKNGMLSEKAIGRALSALERFAERIRSMPYKEIRVVGTNTLRSARNSDTFLARAETILGTPIHIISGIEEARLIYRGVAHDLAPESSRLVVDIGGGSTELILGKRDPLALESIDMGCVSYSQRFFPDGKLSKKRYREAVAAARLEAQDYIKAFGAENWSEAIGSSGTIRAIESILEASGLAEDHAISAEGLETIVNAILAFTQVEDLDIPGLVDNRKPTIVGGLAVLQGLFLELGIKRMHVSGYAVREGVVLDLVDRGQHHDLRSETVKQMMQRYHVDTSQVQRVCEIASRLLEQNRDYFGRQYHRIEKRIRSAIQLHEIGLAIAHNGFHKHGAYLLENSDMPGFSKLEQKHLSFLVLNQRRKLKPLPETYGFTPNWDIVLIMRLSCLLSRRRDNNAPPDVRLAFTDDGARLSMTHQWVEEHPLTMELLTKEKKVMAQQNYILAIDS